MGVKRSLLICLFLLFAAGKVWSQCDQLKSTINIDFGTDQDCAPVMVNQFEITYSFSFPQDPATIEIIYDWNNPANDRTVVDINSGGLVVGPSASGINTTFTANASRLYTANDGQC